jgi:hypothetical protein
MTDILHGVAIKSSSPRNVRANLCRFQRALDGASGVVLTALGLLLSTALLFAGS